MRKLASLGLAGLLGIVVNLSPVVTPEATASVTCAAHFAGRGAGTSGDPYLVANLADLNKVRDCLSSHFKQTANINVGSFLPIGGNSNEFQGSYDGNEKQISNLLIEAPSVDGVGLFGVTKDATLTRVTISSGSVTGSLNVGSLVGNSDTTSITASSSAAVVTTKDGRAGGLVGTLAGGSITLSRASGDVVAATPFGDPARGPFPSMIGGLVGYVNGSAAISRSYASGNVSGYSQMGGLVGHLGGGSVENSYATGNMGTAALPIDWGGGGLVGLMGEPARSISKSYSTGATYGSFGYLGGFLGEVTFGTVETNNFSSGLPVGGLDPSYVGKFFGAPKSDEGYRPVAELNDIDTFIEAGWVISSGWSPVSTWGICGGYNSGFPFINGFFTEANNPCAALTPTFSTPVATSDGFTVNVTNYDANYTWAATVSSGSVATGTASGSTLPLTVSGLAAGGSATVTTTTSRTGYTGGSATVSGTASGGGGSGGGGGGSSGSGSSDSGSTTAPSVIPATPIPAPQPIGTVAFVPVTEKPGAVGALVGGKPVTPTVTSTGNNETLIRAGDVQLGIKGAPNSGAGSSNGSALVLNPGRPLVIAGDGAQPNSIIQKAIFSKPMQLAPSTANAKGEFVASSKVPAKLKPGNHTLQVTGRTKTGEPFVLSVGVVVSRAAATSNAVVKFRPASAELTKGAKANLRELVAGAKGKKIKQARVDGKTFYIAADFARELARERVAAISGQLRKLGVKQKIQKRVVPTKEIKDRQVRKYEVSLRVS